ncbi:hypothetical protein ES332_D04G089500v1 [Gossypium tomentosum]|uniref:RNase H type-1 domain-containing protein n=1 Tax=Gossypium tomentosum TaxID=34277 RepID=A0A5D2LBM2_GOSTO|nr:hypothetical protein ES332_D04G089500v1 [Gossypium tomentosum]
MTYLFSTISREQMRQVAYAIWAIWSARNKALHEGIKQPPESSLTKINFNVTSQSHTKKSCSGIMGRNSNGFVLGSRIIINHIPLRRRLHVFMCKVEIEGDALAIVKKINANVEDGSIISAFIKDLKALSEGHRRCHFVHIANEKNGLTHLLAIEGIKKRETTYLWRRKNDRPIRRTNFDRRKAVIVPDLVYMGRDDGSSKGLLVF